MSITAAMVKDLREKTAAGMMDCKKALTECDGDMEKAVDWLRQKGLSKAAKKAGRATSEGLVGFELAADGKSGVAVEVKCETDFVARGDKFQGFVKDMVAQVAKGEYADSEALLSAPFVADASVTVKEALDGVIATTGENMGLGKFAKMELAAGTPTASLPYSWKCRPAATPPRLPKPSTKWRRTWPCRSPPLPRSPCPPRA